MSEHVKLVEIDPRRFLEVAISLRLQTPEGNGSFRSSLQVFAQEYSQTPAKLMFGLSSSNIKNMRRRDVETPNELPWLLVYFIFKETGTDLTRSESLRTFFALGFDIELAVDVETRNPEEIDFDRHDLKNFNFSISEAKATAADPNDAEFELDLRLGFDRTRLTLRADGMRSIGNRVAGELPLEPSDDVEPDYKGWFDMKPGPSVPLSWFFDPKVEGGVLNGRIFAEYLAKVETGRGAALIAEITARREALKVRIVDESGRQQASKSLADQHRDKMCQAVARRSFAETADEFVLHRLPLVAANRKQK